MPWCHFANFIKILSLEAIPFKKQSEWIFLKKYTIIYFSIYSRVFTKSIISHPFLKSFHSNNSIYKITSPSYGVKEDICRRMPRNFFSSVQFQRKRKSLVFFQSINFLWFVPNNIYLSANPQRLKRKEIPNYSLLFALKVKVKITLQR